MNMNNDLMFSSKSVEWTTPQDLYNRLNAVHHFTLDAAATAENAKCKKFYTKKDDALTKSWANEIVFLNPPQCVREKACKQKIDIDTGKRVYNCKKKKCKDRGYHIDKDIPGTGDWIVKAHVESCHCKVVMLIPARTDTAAWHDCILNDAGNGFQDGIECQFLPGRVKYSEGKDPAPFPSAIVIFDRRNIDIPIDIDSVMTMQEQNT